MSELGDGTKAFLAAQAQKPTNQIVAVGPRKFKLGQHSQHKHTVRYSTTDPDAPVDNVYVKRSAFGNMPPAVYVTIEGA